jgi:3,4-dihydroxy 2-butanone 4-phosphate synthase / GTP cyclohydrolase II
MIGIDVAIAELAAGRMVALVSDDERGGRGALVQAAEHVTPEHINFMTRQAGGGISLALAAERCDALGLPLMAAGRGAAGRGFTVTVEARTGVTTGISTADQARTIRVAADPATTPADLVMPGHVRPVRAAPGGVLSRAGHAEAAVDLARLSGGVAAAVICDIQDEDGDIARRPDLDRYCFRHGLRMVTVDQVVEHRLQSDTAVTHVRTERLRGAHGAARLIVYRSSPGEEEHLALVTGDVDGAVDVLVRVHSACLTGDVFHSRRCDCGEQLERSLEMIGHEGCGVLIYLAQEGRGIGLLNKLRAYKLQEAGLDTVDANLALGLPADGRDYTVAGRILADLGVQSVRLMTNNPGKITALRALGVRLTARVPLEVTANRHNAAYLLTKARRMGHMSGEVDAVDAAGYAPAAVARSA